MVPEDQAYFRVILDSDKSSIDKIMTPLHAGAFFSIAE